MIINPYTDSLPNYLVAPLPTTTPNNYQYSDKAFNDTLSATLSALPTPTLCPLP